MEKSIVEQWGEEYARTNEYQIKNGSYSLPHIYTKNKFQVDFSSKCEKQIVMNILEDTLREYLHDLRVRKSFSEGRKCNHKGKD